MTIITAQDAGHFLSPLATPDFFVSMSDAARGRATRSVKRGAPCGAGIGLLAALIKLFGPLRFLRSTPCRDKSE
jgi:hypothetical protein